MEKIMRTSIVISDVLRSYHNFFLHLKQKAAQIYVPLSAKSGGGREWEISRENIVHPH